MYIHSKIETAYLVVSGLVIPSSIASITKIKTCFGGEIFFGYTVFPTFLNKLLKITFSIA